MTSAYLRTRPSQQAFSLVEVVVAMGVVVFAGFALIGLLNFGLQNSLDSRQQQQAAAIIESICATRRAAPIADFSGSSGPQANFPLPSLTNSTPMNNFSAPLYLTAEGLTTNNASGARFGFIYSITGPASYTPGSQPASAQVYMCLYWPAQASPTNINIGHYEVSTTFALP